MTALEALLFLVACVGATSHLNDMTAGTWRRRLAFALVAGGAFGCAIEPLWPTIEVGARLILALGLAFVSWPIVWRDLRDIAGLPVDRRVERRLSGD